MNNEQLEVGLAKAVSWLSRNKKPGKQQEIDLAAGNFSEALNKILREKQSEVHSLTLEYEPKGYILEALKNAKVPLDLMPKIHVCLIFNRNGTIDSFENGKWATL